MLYTVLGLYDQPSWQIGTCLIQNLPPYTTALRASGKLSAQPDAGLIRDRSEPAPRGIRW